MLIEKALKKENKSKKFFYITMVTLGISIIIIAYLANIKSLVIWLYVLFLEILILLAIMRKINYYRLRYTLLNNRLRIKSGIIANESLLFCDKIAIVHTDNKNYDIEIIIVTIGKSKNKALKPVAEGFVKKYPEATNEYLKLKNKNPNKAFYFQKIRRGALKKYILLDVIYKNCINVVFTTSAIEGVKIARNQIEIKER